MPSRDGISCHTIIGQKPLARRFPAAYGKVSKAPPIKAADVGCLKAFIRALTLDYAATVASEPSALFAAICCTDLQRRDSGKSLCTPRPDSDCF